MPRRRARTIAFVPLAWHNIIMNILGEQMILSVAEAMELASAMVLLYHADTLHEKIVDHTIDALETSVSDAFEYDPRLQEHYGDDFMRLWRQEEPYDNAYLYSTMLQGRIDAFILDGEPEDVSAENLSFEMSISRDELEFLSDVLRYRINRNLDDLADPQPLYNLLALGDAVSKVDYPEYDDGEMPNLEEYLDDSLRSKHEENKLYDGYLQVIEQALQA